MNEEQLNELLYQAFETELGGVSVYETALRCVQNDDLREEWEKYHKQTTQHVDIVEGVLRDASNPNKPSTKPLGDAYMVGKIPGTDVHWGFAVGVLLSIALYILMTRTTFGFAARVTGGNYRAALAQGLPVGRIIVSCAMIAGACAGLAGYFEVAAIQGRANASLAAGYGFTGILVSFLARHNPVVIVPVAILFGGLVASGGLIQRRMGLPDATVLVLQGLIFVVLLTSETLYGRFAIFRPGDAKERT